jgi:hypothetical protein
MDLIRKWSIRMLIVGLFLLVCGYLRYLGRHETGLHAQLAYLLELAIPGWALLIMGWTGWIAYKVCRHGTTQSVFGSETK